MWVIMENNHWMLAECYKSDRQAQFFITAPPNSAGRLLPMIQHLRTALACQNQDFMLHCLDQINPHGPCGRYVVAEIYHRIGLQIAPLSASQELELQTSTHAELLATTLQQARDAWARALVPPDLLHFADTMRRHHLLNISRNQFPQQTFAAAAGSNMDTSSPKGNASAPSQPNQISSGSMTHGSKRQPNQPRAGGETWFLRSPPPSRDRTAKRWHRHTDCKSHQPVRGSSSRRNSTSRNLPNRPASSTSRS